MFFVDFKSLSEIKYHLKENNNFWILTGKDSISLEIHCEVQNALAKFTMNQIQLGKCTYSVVIYLNQGNKWTH